MDALECAKNEGLDALQGLEALEEIQREAVEWRPQNEALAALEGLEAL